MQHDLCTFALSDIFVVLQPAISIARVCTKYAQYFLCVIADSLRLIGETFDAMG